MAAVFAVVLSSPPGRGCIATTPPSLNQNAIASSPGLPSVSKMVAEKMSRPHNANKSTAVAGSTVALQSGKSLPRKEGVTQSSNAQRHLELESNSRGLDVAGTKADAEKSRTERGTTGQAKARHKSKPSSTPKLTRDTVVAKDVIGDENVIDSGRKKRVRKSKKDDQTRIREGKITKPGSSSNTSKHPKKVCTENVRAIVDIQYDLETSLYAEEKTFGAYDDPDLGLIEALRRRRDWTPARDTPKEVRRVSEAPAESPFTVKSADAGLFKRLGEYGFGGADEAAVPRPRQLHDLNGQAATKKRKLHLVAGLASVASKAYASKRSKSPKKKPQTITDKATAPFVPNDQAGISTISSYFANSHRATNPSTTVLSQQHEASNECIEKHDPLRQVKSSKPKAKKQTKTKTKEARILHSPELAVKVINEQDLLFGTCSQLARDESPSFIRDLQRAVKDSEAIDASQIPSQGGESQFSAKTALSDSSITRLPSAARSLWAVAARNDQGQLLEVDVVDLVDTPQSTAVDGDWRTTDALMLNQGATPSRPDQYEANRLEASPRARPKSRSPVNKSTHRTELSTVEGESHPEMPNYKGYTDIELQKEVRKTGFKAMRKREAKISHLEKCWHAARSRRALQQLHPPSTSTSAVVAVDEATKSSSPVKKRGRPRKDSSAVTNENGAGALSSEFPKKARGRPKKGASELSTTSRLQAEQCSATIFIQKSSKTRNIAPLLATITNAVTSYPPTHDVQNLTPYEKMLLYDPIVLEDFAQWLNDEGLKRVGCDETVDPTIAKQWCESQSVCCLWKENLRGGTRARY